MAGLFRIPFLVALALIITFGLGTWSAVEALKATAGFGGIRLGTWEAFPQAQMATADPYAKAHRARAGKLLLGGAEGLSFTATKDAAGQPLNGDCTYVISGINPPARAFTLFATDMADTVLSAGNDLPGALNSWTVLRAADNSFYITVSPNAHAGSWLATRHSGPFKLVLTLLDTPTAGSTGLIDLTMPTLTKTGCGKSFTS